MADTALEDVAFLARSPHRVRVLRRLVEGAQTRATLCEETGISQPTLGRVLGSFEARNWVERRGRAYALTAPGRLVAAAFDELLETVGTVQRLGDVVGDLPTEEMAFGVERFASARVTASTPVDPLQHVRRYDALLDGAERFRIVTNAIAPDSLRDLRDRVVADDATLLAETVITADALRRALAQASLVPLVRDLLTSGRAPVYRYDGDVGMTFGIADGVAFMAPPGDDGVPSALLESEDDAVRDWAVGRFERLRAAATELTVEDLPE